MAGDNGRYAARMNRRLTQCAQMRKTMRKHSCQTLYLKEKYSKITPDKLEMAAKNQGKEKKMTVTDVSGVGKAARVFN